MYKRVKFVVRREHRVCFGFANAKLRRCEYREVDKEKSTCQLPRILLFRSTGSEKLFNKLICPRDNAKEREKNEINNGRR